MYSQKNQQELVFQTIHEMPDQIRDVLLLKFQNDYSYREISSITGIEIQKIGSIIFEGIKHLKKAFSHIDQEVKGHE